MLAQTLGSGIDPPAVPAATVTAGHSHPQVPYELAGLGVNLSRLFRGVGAVGITAQELVVKAREHEDAQKEVQRAAKTVMSTSAEQASAYKKRRIKADRAAAEEKTAKELAVSTAELAAEEARSVAIRTAAAAKTAHSVAQAEAAATALAAAKAAEIKESACAAKAQHTARVVAREAEVATKAVAAAVAKKAAALISGMGKFAEMASEAWHHTELLTPHVQEVMERMRVRAADKLAKREAAASLTAGRSTSRSAGGAFQGGNQSSFSTRSQANGETRQAESHV